MYVSRILPEVRRYGLQAGHLNPMSWCLTCNNRVVMTIPTSKVVEEMNYSSGYVFYWSHSPCPHLFSYLSYTPLTVCGGTGLGTGKTDKWMKYYTRSCPSTCYVLKEKNKQANTFLQYHVVSTTMGLSTDCFSSTDKGQLLQISCSVEDFYRL